MSFLKKIYLAFTKPERTSFLVSSAIALASLIVLASIFFIQTTKAVPAAGGEFTEGALGQPEQVNPVTATARVDLDLVKLIYSNVYDIADSIDATSSGRIWTVRLKENLHWQDGQKLTSDDVIFTVQSIQNPDARSPQLADWQGVAVSRVSELEVQFTLPGPYAFFGDNLKNLYILPKHLFADAAPGNWRLSEYDLKPVGSGPYQFVSYDRTSDGFISGYHLAAWGGSFAVQPLIQNFDFSFFRNENDLAQGFNAGQIDGFAPQMPGDLAAITRPYNLFSWRTPGYYAVFWNQGNNAALQDPSVREALAMAVDRDALISQLGAGNRQGTWYVPDDGPIPPGAAFYSAPQISSSGIDLASSTLDSAGWKMGSDGIRAKTIRKTSVPLSITLVVPQIDFLVRTANYLQTVWRQLGVQVTITPDSPDSIDADYIENRSYQALLFGNILGPSSDLYAFWDSSQRFSPGLNLAVYGNPKADALIESARQTLNNASQTQELAAAEQAIINDAPALFLFSPNDLYAVNKTIQGIAPAILSDPSDRFREVPSWYLETARVLK
ncbi:MAG: peptide ABC transporter substrate-binding protein [Patescibacteria group bacterium]|nr:peptide ABC transporter substrate-binding protein [Patescibacteria group bacterium]